MSKQAAVQWPAGTTCSECGDGNPVDEVNGGPVCRACYDELNDGADTAALDRVAEILRGECGADQISEITQIVAATGRTVGA